MFGWFFSKSKDKKIKELEKRIRELEFTDKAFIGTQSDDDSRVYAKINKDKRVFIESDSYQFGNMGCDCAIKLRDFLLKHFPVEETDIEKPEVSE